MPCPSPRPETVSLEHGIAMCQGHTLQERLPGAGCTGPTAQCYFPSTPHWHSHHMEIQDRKALPQLRCSHRGEPRWVAGLPTACAKMVCCPASLASVVRPKLLGNVPDAVLDGKYSTYAPLGACAISTKDYPTASATWRRQATQ